MRARCVVAGATAVVLLASAAPAARAQDATDIPKVRFALVFAGRGNAGQLNDRFGHGWMWGFEAGWQPSYLGIAWSVAWSVPRWTAIGLGGSFETTDPMAVDEPLGLTELNLGLRVRWPIARETPRFLLITGGGTMLRSTIPIPPDSSRDYVGPYAGIGVQQLLAGRYMVGFEGRYGMLVNGPQGVTFSLSVAFGSQ